MGIVYNYIYTYICSLEIIFKPTKIWVYTK